MTVMFTLEEIASATGGKIVNNTGKASSLIPICRVNKDSRTISDGDLYVAIVGERFDGHDFCDAAVKGGASALLVSDETRILSAECAAVIVDDTVRALGLLAGYYRMKLGCKVIGITGSVGKTTARELTVLACSSSRRVHSTTGNQNNEIGLPMAILSAPADTEIMILEMGMRLRGEISYLTAIAKPDIGVITNAGYSHIERLGSREEIRNAKLEILEGIHDGGYLVLNSDETFLYEYALDYIKNNERSISTATIGILPDGTNDADGAKGANADFIREAAYPFIRANNIRTEEGISFDITYSVDGTVHECRDIGLRLNGIHFVNSAMMALMCAGISGCDMEAAARNLGTYSPMKGRGETVRTPNYVIINDAYNAGPESMEASFLNLSLTRGITADGVKSRRIAVLGGMLELGDYADMLHEQIGKKCGEYDFDMVFVTGNNSESFIRGLREVNNHAAYTLCDDTDMTKQRLLEYIRPGDILLFKASNAFGFEKMALEIISADMAGGES